MNLVPENETGGKRASRPRTWTGTHIPSWAKATLSRMEQAQCRWPLPRHTPSHHRLRWMKACVQRPVSLSSVVAYGRARKVEWNDEKGGGRGGAACYEGTPTPYNSLKERNIHYHHPIYGETTKPKKKRGANASHTELPSRPKSFKGPTSSSSGVFSAALPRWIPMYDPI